MSALPLALPGPAVDADALAAVVGPVRRLERTPLTTAGYTGARHERLDLTLATGERRALVVKHVRPSADWTARRTDDPLGREAALLGEPALGAVWETFACPYVAYAAGPDVTALVMEDLSPWLLPDVREPLRAAQEEAILTALAAMHARFWSSPALDVPWLARPVHYAGLLDAACASDERARAVMPESLLAGIGRGWALALAGVPPGVARVLRAPAAEVAARWDGLPQTLLHGDVKVANVALRPRRRAAAFDWAMVGAGPPSVDLGWYLAVNASRLARSPEDTLGRYRRLLTRARGGPLPAGDWDALVSAAVLCGAWMLLWSKALAVDAGRAGARDEWAWWLDRLDVACA